MAVTSKSVDWECGVGALIPPRRILGKVTSRGSRSDFPSQPISLYSNHWEILVSPLSSNFVRSGSSVRHTHPDAQSLPRSLRPPSPSYAARWGGGMWRQSLSRSRVRHRRVFRKPWKVFGEIQTIVKRGGASGKVYLVCWGERKMARKFVSPLGTRSLFSNE